MTASSNQHLSNQTPFAKRVALELSTNLEGVYQNLSTPRLIEEALKRHEGWLSKDGAFIAHTGVHTGRSAKDKFVVQENNSSPEIWWDSPYQKPLEAQHFQTLHSDLLEHLQNRDVFVLDAYAGADPNFRL